MENEEISFYTISGISYYNHGNYEKALNSFDLALRLNDEAIIPLFFKKKILEVNCPDNCSELNNKIQYLLKKKFDSEIPEFYNQYYDILNFLKCEDNCEDLSEIEYLIRIKPQINNLSKLFRGNLHSNVGERYNIKNLQKAYLIAYYPYNIETIYRELNSVNFESFNYEITDEIKVCLYGCGPSPEFLGILNFISDKMKDINHSRFYFFEMNDWKWLIEGHTLNMTDNYKSNRDLTVIPYLREENILNFNEPDYVDRYQEIKTAKIHVMQNCIRDLLEKTLDYHVITNIIPNIFSMMDSQSLMIINDLAFYNLRDILGNLADSIEKSGMGIVIKRAAKMQKYEPSTRHSGEYRKLIQSRNESKYYSMIILKL